jgi:hypothetical protein
MHRFKKIICLLLILVISSLPAISQACGGNCPMMKKENPSSDNSGMNCHNDSGAEQTSKTGAEKSMCDCDCSMGKSSLNDIKQLNFKTSYYEKFFQLDSQVSERSLSYGIFNPPKFSV